MDQPFMRKNNINESTSVKYLCGCEREYNDQRFWYEIIILTRSDRLITYVIELNKLDESMAKLYIVC